jgi:hypothetical protein
VIHFRRRKIRSFEHVRRRSLTPMEEQMQSWKPRILTAVPQHAEVQLEIVKAMHKLAAEIEEDNELRKRAERAEAERSLKSLQCSCDEAIEALRTMHGELRKYGYDPNEPRVPAGRREGGQWTKGDLSRASDASARALSGAPPDELQQSPARHAASETRRIAAGSHQFTPLHVLPPEILEVAQDLVDWWNSATQSGFDQSGLTGSDWEGPRCALSAGVLGAHSSRPRRPSSASQLVAAWRRRAEVVR